MSVPWGQSAAEEIEHHAWCLWLPFLLEGKAGQVRATGSDQGEIKNCVFKIYTYDQSYSHGIVDRYHWITISRKDPVEEKNHKEEIAPDACRAEGGRASVQRLYLSEGGG